MKITILDADFDFDVFDLPSAEKYEKAMKQVVTEMDAIKAKSESITISESIRDQCTSVFRCFDAVLGDGAAKKVFGDTVNLRTALAAFRDFSEQIEAQKSDIDETAKKYVNRASRRAAAKK